MFEQYKQELAELKRKNGWANSAGYLALAEKILTAAVEQLGLKSSHQLPPIDKRKDNGVVQTLVEIAKEALEAITDISKEAGQKHFLLYKIGCKSRNMPIAKEENLNWKTALDKNDPMALAYQALYRMEYHLTKSKKELSGRHGYPFDPKQGLIELGALIANNKLDPEFLEKALYPTLRNILLTYSELVRSKKWEVDFFNTIWDEFGKMLPIEHRPDYPNKIIDFVVAEQPSGSVIIHEQEPQSEARPWALQASRESEGLGPRLSVADEMPQPASKVGVSAEEEGSTSALDQAQAIRGSNAGSSMESQAEAIPVVTMKELVLTAISEYQQWYQQNKRHLHFSLFHHHGPEGQARAGRLRAVIEKCQTAEEVKDALIKFKSNETLNWNPHSLATFVKLNLMNFRAGLDCWNFAKEDWSGSNESPSLWQRVLRYFS